MLCHEYFEVIGVTAIMSEKIFNTKFKKAALSDPYHGQLVEPKSLNKNEEQPLAKPTMRTHAYSAIFCTYFFECNELFC